MGALSLIQVGIVSWHRLRLQTVSITSDSHTRCPLFPGVEDARTFPAPPLALTAYSGAKLNTIPQLYDMYLETVADAPFLTSADFQKIQPLCFQIGAGAKGTWDVAEDTSVQFNGTLNIAPFGGIA